MAFVVPAAGESVTAHDLAAFVGGRLARYKVPKEFHFLDQLPRTAYGKVVKGELVEIVEEGERELGIWNFEFRNFHPTTRDAVCVAISGSAP